MQVHCSCDLDLHLEVETPLILMLRPRSGSSQWVFRDNYTFSRKMQVVEYQDMFGNLCQRVVAPATDFRIHTSAEVETAGNSPVSPGAPFVNIEDLPIEALGYLVPTRYCESDRLGDVARNIVGDSWLGYDQVATISQWINSNVQYLPGSSDVPLTAQAVAEQGHGVCRDLAHLGIALCRSISIPARMVVGYLVGLQPMDLHTWFEAYVGDAWYTFDPSQNNLDQPRVAIACGRDAADVAIFHQFGPLPISSAMEVQATIVG